MGKAVRISTLQSISRQIVQNNPKRNVKCVLGHKTNWVGWTTTYSIWVTKLVQIKPERFRIMGASLLFRENIQLKGHLESALLDVEAVKKSKEDQDVLNSIQKLKADAKKDIKPIEDGIMHDLQNLHNLRKVFVQDLRNRIRIVSSLFRLETLIVPKWRFFTMMYHLHRHASRLGKRTSQRSHSSGEYPSNWQSIRRTENQLFKLTNSCFLLSKLDETSILINTSLLLRNATYTMNLIMPKLVSPHHIDMALSYTAFPTKEDPVGS